MSKSNPGTYFLFLLTALSFSMSHAAATSSHHFKKVVWMVFENTDYQTALKQTDFKSLAQTGVLFTNFSAETHPSQGNYIAMIAGSDMGIHHDRPVTLGGQHVGDLLEKAGMQWKVYAEGFPGKCFLGKSSGHYARRHNPFISFSNVTGNPKRCENIESSDRFDQDLKTGNLPEFSMYIPDTKNDGHDTNIDFAGKWLKTHYGEVLSHPETLKDTLFIITFDEADGAKNNQVYNVLIGDQVKGGIQNTQKINHVALLRMIEDEFGLGNLGRDDAKAPQILGIWK